MVFAPVNKVFTEWRDRHDSGPHDWWSQMKAKFEQLHTIHTIPTNTLRKQWELTIVKSFRTNCSSATQRWFSISATQFSVNLNVDVNPIGETCTLYTTTFSDTKFWAAEGMLKINQRFYSVRWVEVMRVISVIVSWVVMIWVTVVVTVTGPKEGPALDIWIVAARPCRRYKVFGDGRQYLLLKSRMKFSSGGQKSMLWYAHRLSNMNLTFPPPPFWVNLIFSPSFWIIPSTFPPFFSTAISTRAESGSSLTSIVATSSSSTYLLSPPLTLMVVLEVTAGVATRTCTS